jgi:predicted GIY-YIG superfamily endonuclease
MKKVFVYTIVNNNGKVEYVGQTTNPKKRLYEHQLISGKFYNREDIKMIIIKECNNRKDALNYEEKLQKKCGFETDRSKRIAAIKGVHGGLIIAEIYSKPVLVYDYKTNKFIGEFTSQRQASIKLNLNKGNITSALNGKYKQTGGYIFKLKQNY